tara:strand:+ start:395 stop:1078 length:684 start_codon:yes stop_codon:yes gene_type:complete
LIKVSAIIPAAGSGSRFGEEKQFKVLKGRPLWAHTLKPFINSNLINELIVVFPENSIHKIQSSEAYKLISKKKEIKLVSGGTKRKDSVLNGLLLTKKTNELVCIHDVARPLIKESLIDKAINKSAGFDGCILAMPITDTVKILKGDIVHNTINRSTVWMAQTPQVFRKDKLLKAYRENSSIEITDESTLMELMGFSIKVINGDMNNIKITNKVDWEIAKIIMENQNK